MEKDVADKIVKLGVRPVYGNQRSQVYPANSYQKVGKVNAAT